jgi:hypothetical protein
MLCRRTTSDMCLLTRVVETEMRWKGSKTTRPSRCSCFMQSAKGKLDIFSRRPVQSLLFSSGLTLTSCRVVHLLEPVLRHSFELQAIGRVDRQVVAFTVRRVSDHQARSRQRDHSILVRPLLCDRRGRQTDPAAMRRLIRSSLVFWPRVCAMGPASI